MAIFEQICSFENLYSAFHKARKGKRHKEQVARFECDLEGELLALQAELLSGAYHPGPYSSFYRTEAKRRLISAAPFRDRIVHHALVRVIEPEFERRFIFDSYANRTGKGTHRALDRCTQFMRRNVYLLPCDIRQFFPSIDHAILLDQLEKVIHDSRTLNLIRLILSNGVGVLDEMYEMQWFHEDDLLAFFRPRGLPLGNLTSQFWANVHLNDLDQFVKRQLKCRDYLRYVDDFVLFSNDKSQLHLWRQEIIHFLANLRLKLHETQAQIRPSRCGFPLLGFTVFPDHRRLRSRNGHAFQRKYCAQRNAFSMGEITFEQLDASVKGWVAHAAHGDTWGLRNAILGRTSV